MPKLDILTVTVAFATGVTVGAATQARRTRRVRRFAATIWDRLDSYMDDRLDWEGATSE